MLHLGDNISLIRSLSDKKQKSFAKRFDISEAMLKSYESNKVKEPNRLFISRLSKFAHVSEDDLWNKALAEEDIKIKKVEKVETSNQENKEIQVADMNGLDNKLSEKIIYNLSESNRQQSEANNKQADANKIQAEANLMQVKQNETLTSIIKTTVHADQRTLQESVAMIVGLREYLIELGSHVNKVPKKEVEQLLNNKVKRAKERAEKMDTLSEERR